jgi:hypothetical protein
LIVSSVIAADARQVDGRRAIAECHTDHRGLERWYRYTADAGVDVVTLYIAANLAAVATLGAQAAPAFNYSTVAQNVAALRAAYASATQQQAIFTGEYLGSLTDAQLQSAFGLTVAQVTTLRSSKLAPAASAAATIRAAAGA